MIQMRQSGATGFGDLAQPERAPRTDPPQTGDAFAPRIENREDVHIATRISVADRPREITLVNLSAHGFMGECLAGVPLRSRVSLDLPGLGPWRGSVRWSVGRRVGGRFDTPLDADQLAAALS